ncbi:MAG TPA: DUF1501 domain-containing protein [Acidimicrobiales bacterium]|nr:DUF1501 domain-containing protein [Acidimicrobiales bacterium]
MTPSDHPPSPPPSPDRLLQARAAQVADDERLRRDLWGSLVTRRRVLAGMAGAAASPLVTTRASFAAQATEGTLVVVFLRGGMDGLSAVVPADDPHLLEARPNLAVRSQSLLPLARGFGLHPSLAPLHELWKRGQLTAVPAVSTPDISRSHFQAQDCLERGGATTGTTEGWLDRVLDKLGPGTSFRSVAQGHGMQRALTGDQPSIALSEVAEFTIAGWEGIHDQTIEALGKLYTGVDPDLMHDVTTTLGALATVEQLAADTTATTTGYPEGDFGKGLAELARLVKAGTGLRVACIDLGDWDTHGHQGSVDGGLLKDQFERLSGGLAAFAADLGDKLSQVTVVVMTEFGRRIEENASAGTDHGHGAAVLLMGGKLNGGTIHGNWQGLAPEVRDQGDVPGSNDYRNVLGDVVTGRLGLSAADMASVFPDHRFQPLGIMA